KLSDIVNKTAWKTVCCSRDGEFICGATTEAYSLYIWDRPSGELITMLHGTTELKGEALQDAQWHPTKAVILSIGNGIVSVWARAPLEMWSAFCPEFSELEENQKYAEKEGEFDGEDEDASEEEKEEVEDMEDVEVDVVNLDADEAGCSSDEDDARLPTMPTTSSGPLWFLPTVPVIDNPEYLNPTSQPSAPYADVNFLDQPAGGMPMQYENEND
ncbi:hypothetical protein PMAYCL1PPCAC_09060, partial [Pristionchus mayeri]